MLGRWIFKKSNWRPVGLLNTLDQLLEGGAAVVEDGLLQVVSDGDFSCFLVNSINQYSLDGLDFDWEHPGATDIPDVPSGSPEDGKEYPQFLKDLRSALPKGATMSIAAPASYWYLQGFPIKDMSEVLDFIIYMTYDLHGQWDYDNAFSAPGRPARNCLRSHVNMTETEFALAMITKAGVPSNKVVVGVSSYGRAFQMTAKGCTGPMRTYTEPESGATPRKCTATVGFCCFSLLSCRYYLA
jgi:chitinase